MTQGWRAVIEQMIYRKTRVLSTEARKRQHQLNELADARVITFKGKLASMDSQGLSIISAAVRNQLTAIQAIVNVLTDIQNSENQENLQMRVRNDKLGGLRCEMHKIQKGQETMLQIRELLETNSILVGPRRAMGKNGKQRLRTQPYPNRTYHLQTEGDSVSTDQLFVVDTPITKKIMNWASKQITIL